MEDKITQRLFEHHPGWIEHEDSARKVHYFLKEDGDWYIAICGELLPDRDLANRWETNYTCNALTDKYCKRCLKKYRQLKNGEAVTIKLKGILI